MDSPNDQSDGRFPQPSSRSGSNCDPIRSVLPKRTSVARRHSPLASKFVRTQSGLKSPSASFQVRVIDGGKMPPPPPRMRIDGLVFDARLLTLAPCRYLPRFTFSAVFPVPNRSYAAPRRGVRSL